MSKKCDVERLLAEAHQHLVDYSDVSVRGYHILDAQRKITDALSVLENMEEGEEIVWAWPPDMTRSDAEEVVKGIPHEHTLVVLGNLNLALGRMIITNRRVITLEDTELVLKPIEPPAEEPEKCDWCGSEMEREDALQVTWSCKKCEDKRIHVREPPAEEPRKMEPLGDGPSMVDLPKDYLRGQKEYEPEKEGE